MKSNSSIFTDRQVSDIFTKALGSGKVQHFSEMLGLQHLDVPHLRGRTETGGATEEKEVELTEEVGTSDRVGTSENGGKVKKDRTDRKMKTKTRHGLML